jgi:glycosyltransferase involved in cell wall biosynthesis
MQEQAMHNSRPLISIIVINHNYGKYVEDAIESALHQTYRPVEIIVVDDGSTDDSVEVIQQYPIDRLVAQENKGVAAAFDAGVRASHGACYIRLDADDILHPDYVMKTSSLLNRNPEVAFAYTSAFLFGAVSSIQKSKEYSLRELLKSNFITSTALVRSGAYHAVGGYDPELPLLEDWDHWLTFAEHGLRGVLLPEPLLYWRRHTFASRNRQPWHVAIEADHRIRRKHKRLYHEYSTLTDKCKYRTLEMLRIPKRLLLKASPDLAERGTKLFARVLMKEDAAVISLPSELTSPKFSFLSSHCCKLAGHKPVSVNDPDSL